MHISHPKAYQDALNKRFDINLCACYIEALQEIDRLNSLNDELHRMLSRVVRDRTELLKAIEKFNNII